MLRGLENSVYVSHLLLTIHTRMPLKVRYAKTFIRVEILYYSDVSKVFLTFIAIFEVAETLQVSNILLSVRNLHNMDLLIVVRIIVHSKVENGNNGRRFGRPC